MTTMKRIAGFMALTVALNLAGQGTIQAAETAAHITLRPMSGSIPSGQHRQAVLSTTLGVKQAVGYFLNENGACRVTIMVGEAFNGTDIPAFSTIRFEVAIGEGRTARMDTAEGKSLEFACGGRAEEMVVRESSVTAPARPGT